MIKPRLIKRIPKYLFVLGFIGAIGAIAYFSVQELFYSNRVKVIVMDRKANKPLRNHHVVLRTVCTEQPCEAKTLVEGRTNLLGHLGIVTKQLSDSFEVVAEGYQTDGPWLKRPGSLFFSRNYEDHDFYSANIAQTDLEIKLMPSGQ